MSASATLNDFDPSSERDNRCHELPPYVDLELADNADACGKLGCRTSSPLFTVSVDGVKRTLCILHSEEYISERCDETEFEEFGRLL
jgi:hypothetical protein